MARQKCYKRTCNKNRRPKSLPQERSRFPISRHLRKSLMSPTSEQAVPSPESHSGQKGSVEMQCSRAARQSCPMVRRKAAAASRLGLSGIEEGPTLLQLFKAVRV
ncbi:hypothetical protein AVEN_156383-1 [Araneus ventricosus]|uniref:Uncharacterized protein n=1 Tax=Araneus ventricosus TaxID=182803 RepID=A0A4Y2DIZ3_ARAVE|nr:hypothetical protein AVEN_38628-1 [Araneus ventricosus]GBM15824.1 hypothetical protein AVEN_156383-1 [Araneus ventricosus]